MSNYFINVDGEEQILQKGDLKALDIIQTANNQFHVLQNGQAFHVKVLETNFLEKTLTLEINGNKHQLNIEDEYDHLVKEMGLSANVAQKIKSIKAPMPGLILDILVEEGQEIEKGTQLLILEAMKMENVLKSEGEGVIKSIEVTKGTAVEKGQVLIEME